MNNAEYQNMFEQERDHFFYRFTHDAVLQIASTLHLTRPVKILDVGCGTGMLVKKLQRIGIAEGVDAHPNAVRFGKKRNIRIRRGLIGSLPFRTRSFHLVTCIDVLCHRSIQNDVTALKELKRVLLPGGILILRVPAHQYLYGAHDHYVHTKYRYSKNKLLHLLKRSGFSVPYITYMNAGLFIPSVLKKISELVLQPREASTVTPLPKWLNNVLYSMLKLEIPLLKKRVEIPFGIEVIAVCRNPNH